MTMRGRVLAESGVVRQTDSGQLNPVVFDLAELEEKPVRLYLLLARQEEMQKEVSRTPHRRALGV